MQQLNIAGRRVLAFYDSGANSNIVEYDLARDAGFHQIGFQTVSFNVAGGGSVRSSYGQFSAILGPDVNGNIHNIECQAVDQITGTFPMFRLDDVITEAKATVGSHHVFPQEIRGAPVKLLIGIRSTQLAPVLKFTLPSGLCVYDSKFRDVYGATLCFSGPHEVFTRAYRQAGYRVTSGMLQVLFTESAAAYRSGIRAVVGPSIEEEEAAEPISAPVSAPLVVAPPPVPVGPAGDNTTAAPSVPLTEEVARSEGTDNTDACEPVTESPGDPLPVVTAKPEPATDTVEEEIQPDLPAPLMGCADETPPLVSSGALPNDACQLLAADILLKPAAAVEPTERDLLLMIAPSAPADPPTPPEPSTGMDDQKISPVEELAQEFTAVTIEIVDKPPDEPLERPKTPRAFADRDRECYYVTTDYGSSDDERNGAKPPEHDKPADAHRDPTAAFVASPLTCDEESLCTKSRRKANETFVQTINTGVPGRDFDLKVMFDAKLPQTLISHEAAGDAVLNPSGGEKFVVGADVEFDWSECRYTVPLVDSGGRTQWLKARGVEYTVYVGPRIVPPNASMVFPEMAGPPSTAHQQDGIVHMIVGRDNLQWHPRRVRDSPRAADNLMLFASRFPPEYMVKQTMLTACDGTTHTPRRRRRRRRPRRKPRDLEQ